ncbi:hypothetical protein ASF37_07305 [Aeromicrobium sp. Leaf289]|uniref:hypothetical protein n=1 Tax=Aeromicrobium sp. Leaf289 TaxID=1736324 RepID=UPI0006FF3673|nr:hypothetical protein [Aeromicrobium sp. Leaf289]KQP78366.1 hypothetical protein ASF37_07305 [Aeromicrobium sp. Leaf289]
MKKSLRRGLVATAATALGAGLLAVPAAQADTSRTPQTVNAADWLSGQVVDGVLYNEQFDFVDWGLTLDTLLALDAVGGYNAKVADIADALAEDLGSYIGTGEEKYAGSTAKALVAAQAADRNAADFGGTDLVGATEARVDGTGRLADESAFGNFANVFGQAFAVKGLHAADSGEAPAATTFLLQQQCADGGFRLDFTATDTSCSGDDAQTDSTAIAVDALLPQSGTPAVATALAEAEAWLVSQQGDDKSFSGGPGTETANTNSTAVAAVALEKLGEEQAAADAAAWIAQRQVTAYSACGTELDGQFGAVGYDDAAIATAEDDGIEVETADQWRRATAPAITALQSYDDPSPLPKKTFEVTAPSGYVAAGAPVALTASGLAPGERYCVYSVDGSIAKAGKANTSGVATISATAPSPGVRPVYVYGERDARQGEASLRVLTTTKRFVATTNVKTVKRNGRIRVSARGLAPSEPVRIGYGGTYIKTTNARTDGTIDYTFGVGSSTGKKNVYVRGIVNTRQGIASFTVVK